MDKYSEKHIENFQTWTADKQAWEAYKFAYYPSFHRSFDIVVWRDYEEKLQVAMQLDAHFNGEGKPLPTKKQEGPLDQSAWHAIQHSIDQIAFWDKRDWEERWGLDGSRWYFLGLRNGSTKIRGSWSPEEGEPASELGWVFFNLVPANFCPVMKWSQAQEAYISRSISPDSPVIVVYQD